MTQNEHISQYLDYYLSLEASPEFAILLSGEWGVGKTWFLKKYLQERNADHVYISLNGLGTTAEIDQQFFRELHPVLASKQMKFVSKLVKGLLKTTIQLDLDGNSKTDVNVGSALPDINLPDFLRNINEKLLVFDDLERCAMPITSILGYINQFVEDNGLKVVILANEEEILKSEEQQRTESKAYRLIREKLVGRNFQIASDPESALEYFLGNLANKDIRKLLIQKKTVMLQSYFSAGYGNLRHLRQSILDFERFYQFLPKEIFQVPDLTDHVLALFFAIAIELRKGYLNEGHLTQLLDPYTSRPSSATTSPVAVAKAKHIIFSGPTSPILVEDWILFFKKGRADQQRIKESLFQSVYYLDQNTPDWIKLWHYFDLEDTAFENLLSKLFQSFQDTQIQQRYEIMHLTSIFLKLADDRLLESDSAEILQLGRENLRLCGQNGGLKLANPFDQFPDPRALGYAYHSGDDARFQDFLIYAKNLSSEYMQEVSVGEAKRLLKILKKSVSEFSAVITLSNSGTSTFFNQPVLHHIPAKDFLNVYFELSAPSKRELARVIEKRYQLEEYAHFLLEELGWLRAIHEEGNRRNVEGIRKLSTAIFEITFLPAIERSIARLSRYSH